MNISTITEKYQVNLIFKGNKVKKRIDSPSNSIVKVS